MPYFDPDLRCYRVPLSSGMTALIDAEDVDEVAQHVWSYSKPKPGWRNRLNDVAGFAFRTTYDAGYTGFILLSRLIAKPADHEVVNFANDDTLDCRRANLRKCNRTQATARARKRRGCTSRFKGVSRARVHKKWTAEIFVDNRTIVIGKYDHEDDAARAYDAQALRYFGPFARLNFPQEVQ